MELFDLSNEKREKDWAEIEDLIKTYQKQFIDPSTTEEEKVMAKNASERIIEKFSPLFAKYISILKYGVIDFEDLETKLFVSSFIDDIGLRRSLNRKKQSATVRNNVYNKFNFIKETYGNSNKEEILYDLQFLLLILAKRYKPMGKSFCAYVYNTYRHEVSRHIKNFIKNPLNIQYKNKPYEDYINANNEEEFYHEDNYYESATGVPDMFWISGQTCSNAFSSLSNLDRQILVKYYMEEWSDKIIAEEFGLHINTINQRRRAAIATLAGNLDMNEDDIKRRRRSGKNAVRNIKNI